MILTRKRLLVDTFLTRRLLKSLAFCEFASINFEPCNTNKFFERYTEHSRPIYIPSPVTRSLIYSHFDVADVLFYKLGEVVEQIYM